MKEAPQPRELALGRLDRRGEREQRGELLAQARDRFGERRQRVGHLAQRLDVTLDGVRGAVHRRDRLVQIAHVAGQAFRALLGDPDDAEHRARGVGREVEHPRAA